MENSLKSLQQLNNTNKINDDCYKKLVENCFAILTGNTEIYNLTTLYNSKPDVIKEFYASLLSLTAHFVRNNETNESIKNNLKNCGFSHIKQEFYVENYEKKQKLIEISLVNVGNYLPHITDVNWKIDYIVKTNILDESQGPLFRISLITEKSLENYEKKIEYINFTCNSQELQDFVYKLKDALRHCQKVVNEH